MHILLIEDNNALANLLQFQLKNIGNHSTIITNNKADALQMFKQNTFDLIMIDMGLEGIPDRGLEILKAIKNLKPSQRIGVLSSNDYKNIIVSSQKEGADFYMIKPFSIDGLKLILNGDKEAFEYYQPNTNEGRIIIF